MRNNVKIDEMTGTFAVVGCGDNPNHQVWGARSDLGCKRKMKKPLKMKFKEWVEERGKNNGR